METFHFKSCLNTILVWGLLLCSISVFADEKEQPVTSTITNVTIFINQAQVTRSAKVSVDAGVTILVFDKLSPFINLNSIQVKADPSISLIAVTNRTNYLKETEKPAFIAELEDSLESINWIMEGIKAKKEGYHFEREVMSTNKSISGANVGIKPDDLEDALNLFHKKWNEVNEELIKLNQQEKKIVAIKAKIENQLNEYRSGLDQYTPEVLVTVKTFSPISNGKIELSYLVSNASWKPFYDIRVKDVKSPLQLVSKAFITQATGEDWKNVVLKLSTSNPNEGGSKPQLQTNYLQFYQPQSYGYQAQEEVAVMRKNAMAAPEAPKSEAKSDYSAGVATVSQTNINIEFNVTSASNIPSDNNPHQVDLTVSNLDAVYAYAAVPKLDKDAFVTAKVSGNDLVNQISGEANVYFDGTFTGKTYINGTTNDSLLLSLGRDKRIQIQRMMLKDFSSKSFSGGNKKELNTWEITIRNTRKEPIILFVEDQIPVSTDKEIEIKLIDSSHAIYDETTGKLTWVIRLDAEQSQSVKFSFEVKYPKEKQISTY
jgi:uncharacterized protein (TIGR02231 family)